MVILVEVADEVLEVADEVLEVAETTYGAMQEIENFPLLGLYR